MVMGLIQPLTELSTRNFPEGYVLTLSTPTVDILSEKPENLGLITP
jgi:hypothetical protein